MSLKTLKIIFYILAVLILILGLVGSISLLAGAANVHNSLISLQILGGEMLANIVTPLIAGLLTTLGIVALVITLMLSALLYGAGRLAGHADGLEARLAHLESVNLR